MKTNQISPNLFTSNGYSIEECVNVINFLENHCPSKLTDDLMYNSESTCSPSLLLKVKPQFMKALNDMCYELDRYETIKSKLIPIISEQKDAVIKGLLQGTIDSNKPDIDITGYSLNVVLKYLIQQNDYMNLPFDFFWYMANGTPFAKAVKDCYELSRSTCAKNLSHSDKYLMEYWTHIFKG